MGIAPLMPPAGRAACAWRAREHADRVAVPQKGAIQRITPNEMRGAGEAIYSSCSYVFGALGAS